MPTYRTPANPDKEIAAEAIGYLAQLPRHVLYKLISFGAIPAHKTNAHWYVYRSDALQYLANFPLPSKRYFEPVGCANLRYLLRRHRNYRIAGFSPPPLISPSRAVSPVGARGLELQPPKRRIPPVVLRADLARPA